jgi:Lamin Tail Domain/FlgD Ig-like domain
MLTSNDSVVVSFALPQIFYGLFPATVYIIDSLDENPTNDTLRFSLAPPIPPDSLVINEIMFDPQPGGCEWLELYNRSSKWISIDSTRLITGESRPGEYTHIIPSLVIAPDSFGLIAANDSIYHDYPSLIGRSSITSLGTSSLDFGVDSCFVVLRNQDSSTIDSVHYFKTWQYSLLRKTFPGISLERKDPRGPSNDPQNWQASLNTLGATPLAPNSGDTSSVTTPPPASTTFQASFSPNPFSPDGDGFEDASVLTVQTGNTTQWAIRVRLYDASGRLVRTLTDATAVYQSIALTFDGKRDDGQTLPPGLYTVLVELTSQSPLQTLKQEIGVVIAGKRR